MNQLFATICWLKFLLSLSASWSPTSCSLRVCGWKMWHVTLFLWILLSQEEFSQQPAVTWPAWLACGVGTIEWSLAGVLQVWHIYRQSAAQWATARHAWPATAVPSSGENFYYIPFLTRWQAEITEPEPVWCAHRRKYAILAQPGLTGQIWIFIWAAWLCYLMRHVKAECEPNCPVP